jgi:hypothetical protein
MIYVLPQPTSEKSCARLVKRKERGHGTPRLHTPEKNEKYQQDLTPHEPEFSNGLLLAPVDGRQVHAFVVKLPKRAGDGRREKEHHGVSFDSSGNREKRKQARKTHLMSLSRVTAPTILEMTKSISCSVVNRPIPNRKLEWAMSSLAPSARRT